MNIEEKERFQFLEAKPVWQLGEENTMNRTVSFCTDVAGDCRDAVLYAAASCSYVVLVNGKMIAHGPQRCAHGFYRVDALALGSHLTDGVNVIAVRVAGYNANSFSNLDQPSFFCGEIRCGDRLLAYTGDRSLGWRAYVCAERLQKVPRFSYQRTFLESYDLARGSFACERGVGDAECVIVETQPKVFLCRNVPVGDYEALLPQPLQQGTFTVTARESDKWARREAAGVSPEYKGFARDEVEYASFADYDRFDFGAPQPCPPMGVAQHIADGEYMDLDFGRDYAGCFEFDVSGKCDTLFFAFDEILLNGQVNPMRFSCFALISWQNLDGSYHFVSAEPYTLRYLRIAVRGGKVRIANLHLNKIAFPASHITARLQSDDPVLRQIYDAAVETFCANAVDIYMDCPSRERAGWLCDSFFTSRVERVLTGKSEVEHAFLQNFLLPDSFKNVPRGMLPMCYPSDFPSPSFIPNWAMWYVVELAEYLDRTGDTALVAQARPRLMALDRYFRRFENEFGLLEKLGNWVFVEWSKANELVQDVNYPTNMLYVGYKRALAKLYGDNTFAEEADQLVQTIRAQAITPSGFFCDNAVRTGGELRLSGERTETCQYYAFFFNVASPDTDAALWQILLNDFGPDRAQTGKYPEIYPANAFIGNYLRLETLCRYGCRDALLENIRGYFAYMAEQTGTLWENITTTASCNHGFASHVIYWLDQLGLLGHDR